MKYTYPAIFTEEDKGLYSVSFPDVEGCYTCGDNLDDALYMANDALSLMLVHLEDTKKVIPSPSKPQDINVNSN